MTDRQKIETIKDLIDVLSVFSPDTKIAVNQPRRWTKKQPDNCRTYITGFSFNGYWINFETDTNRP